MNYMSERNAVMCNKFQYENTSDMSLVHVCILRVVYSDRVAKRMLTSLQL